MSKPHARPCYHPQPVHEAVDRCCQSRNQALQDCAGLDMMEWDIAKIGAEAYLASMPVLDSLENIRDYAACINHAIAINVIQPSAAPPLLSSARIVLNIVREEEKQRRDNTKLDHDKIRIMISQSREQRHAAKERITEVNRELTKRHP